MTKDRMDKEYFPLSIITLDVSSFMLYFELNNFLSNLHLLIYY